VGTAWLVLLALGLLGGARSKLGSAA
jgi:hypothetical protein